MHHPAHHMHYHKTLSLPHHDSSEHTVPAGCCTCKQPNSQGSLPVQCVTALYAPMSFLSQVPIMYEWHCQVWFYKKTTANMHNSQQHMHMHHAEPCLHGVQHATLTSTLPGYFIVLHDTAQQVAVTPAAPASCSEPTKAVPYGQQNHQKVLHKLCHCTSAANTLKIQQHATTSTLL